MSASLAFTAVTAALHHVLAQAIATWEGRSDLGEVQVLTSVPDQSPSGADERALIHVFLYRVAPCPPAATCLDQFATSQPARVDLFYLVTSYSKQELVAEALLGAAAHILKGLRTLETGSITGITESHVRLENLRALALDSYTTTQVTPPTISPVNLSLDESLRLFAGLNARFRPALAYRISGVVLG